MTLNQPLSHSLTHSRTHSRTRWRIHALTHALTPINAKELSFLIRNALAEHSIISEAMHGEESVWGLGWEWGWGQALVLALQMWLRVSRGWMTTAYCPPSISITDTSQPHGNKSLNKDQWGERGEHPSQPENGQYLG